MTFSWLNTSFAHGMRNSWSNCPMTLRLLSIFTAQFCRLKCWYALLGCVMQPHSGIVSSGFVSLILVEVLYKWDLFLMIFFPRGVLSRVLDTCCMFHTLLLTDVEPGGVICRHCACCSETGNITLPAGGIFFPSCFGSISSWDLMKTGGISSFSLIGTHLSCSLSCGSSILRLSLFKVATFFFPGIHLYYDVPCMHIKVSA